VTEQHPTGRWLHRLVSQRELRLMLALLALLTLLLLIDQWLTRLGDGAVAAAWLLLWLPLLALLFWRRRMARRAWLRVHLRRESPWVGRLHGGLVMLFGQGLVAGALALALLISLARGVPSSTWIVLVLCVPLWAKAWSGTRCYLGRHASEEFLAVTAARLLVWGAAALLLLGLATWGLWRPLPDLGELSLFEAVGHFSASQEAQSPLLRFLLTLTAALDGARHWLAQHWFEGLPGLGLRLVAWMVVLVQEWLFVWPSLLLWEAVSHVVYGHATAVRTQPSPGAN